MPFQVPDPPPDSWFQISRDDEDRVRLTWAEPFTWRSYLVTRAVGLGFTGLLAWFLHHNFLMPVLQQVWGRGGAGGNAQPGVALTVLFGMLLLPAVAMVLTLCWTVYAFLRIEKPDQLTLGDSVLRYEFDGFSGLRRHVRTIPRSEFGEVRIDRVQDPEGMPPRQCLIVDHGAEPVEIGKDLREPDRGWLAEVLRAWGGEKERRGTSSIPELPVNARISVDRDAEGRLTLGWRPVSAGQNGSRWMGILHLSVWLFAWAVGEVVVIFTVAAIVMGHWQPWGAWQWIFLGAMLVWLPGWTFGGCMAISHLSALAWPARTCLILTPSVLQHKPGRYFDGREVRSGARCEIPQSALGPIRLERTPEGQRLTIDHGAERIEIGPTLRDPEREWLADVLRAWTGREPRAAADERSASAVGRSE